MSYFFSLVACILTILPDTMADTSDCNTLQLGPKDPLLITIFDNAFNQEKLLLYDNFCTVLEKFPKGLLSVEYRPGALATGSIDNIKCGSGDCQYDQYHECSLMQFPNAIYTCVGVITVTLADVAEVSECFCNQDSNQLLLDNAKLRADWGVPEDIIPTLAFNQQYDSCAKFGSVEEITNYICQVYQKKLCPPC